MQDRLRLIVIALFLVAMGVESAGAVSRITFFSFREDNYDIYVMDVDGSNQTRLTFDPSNDHVPAWSPDGQKIAFSSRRDGNWEIYLMDSNGVNRVNLTNHASQDSDPIFSPDGSRIAFNSNRDGIFEIYAMDLDGSNVTRLTNNVTGDFHPAWSPDGTRIAYQAQTGSTFEIRVMDADGSNDTLLASEVELTGNPAWSPDSNQITFMSAREGVRHIYVMNADGSNQIRITHNTSPNNWPAWSPSGAQIAFVRYADGNQNIFVMDADGSNAVPITTSATAEYKLDWSRELSEPVTTVSMVPTSNALAETAGPQTLQVVLGTGGSALASPVSVGLSVSGSALIPDDYALSTQTVLFPAGSADGASSDIVLTVADDLLMEGNESIGLALDGASLTGPASLGWPGALALTLIDDESATISFVTAASSLGEGSLPFVIPVVLQIPSGTLAGEVSVGIIASGSAIDPEDYTLSPESAVFPAGSADGMTVDLTLTVIDDTRVEGTEDVTLSLDPASLVGAATLAAPTTHTVAIDDNDAAAVAFALAASSLAEGDAPSTIQAVLDTAGGTLGAAVSLDIALGGTATAGSDYTLDPQSVNFPVGSGDGTVVDLVFSPIDDLFLEGAEQALLTLDPGSLVGPAALGAPGSHDVTLLDDDTGAAVPATWGRGLWLIVALLTLGFFALHRRRLVA